MEPGSGDLCILVVRKDEQGQVQAVETYGCDEGKILRYLGGIRILKCDHVNNLEKLKEKIQEEIDRRKAEESASR